MTKKSKQKFKYLENKKGFKDAKKKTFLAFNEANITIFSEGESPTLTFLDV